MVVFGENGSVREKRWYSGKSGCIWGKVFILLKVVVFGQKWLYSGKVDVSGQKWLYSGKIVVFGQKLMFTGKSGCFRANTTSRSNWLYSGKVNVFV